MTELSGTLEGVGLPAIIRFLSGLEKTGCLRIVHDDWQGEIVFEAGQLTGASLGSRNGLSALDGLVQTLSGGNFTFDTSPRPASQANIDLPTDVLQGHLDELVARIVGGTPNLPSVDSVPQLIAQDELGEGAEPLPLDRATLQTLLAVDGKRTVRQIVAQRRSFEALWQLGSLAAVGLVRFTSHVSDVEGPSATAAVHPVALEPEPQPAVAHCPRLGFEDDPGNSFDRPTRLHRCFAADTPLPLSLEQQRELCLSDQFSTCPRLTSVVRRPARPPARDVRTAPPPRNMPGNVAPAIGADGHSGALPAEPEVDDSRIVRLPFAARNAAAQRGSTGEPTHLHAATSTQRSGEPTRPTPLRARIERAHSAGLAATQAEPPASPTAAESQVNERASFRALIDGGPSLLRVGGVPIRVILGGAIAVVVLAVLGYVIAPHLGELAPEDTTDLAGLPNASAVAAGTPIEQIAPRPTRAPGGVASPAAASATAALPGGAGPLAATGASAVPAAPAASAVAAVPAAPGAPTTAAETAASGQATAVPPASAPLLDEHFTDNARNWPSNAQGTAWLTGGSYRLIPREAGQFVAVGAPVAEVFKDVLVSATFHKLSGTPDGGGFGIIVRDQGTLPLDGASQGGQYYVLEVGDKGEVGIWRRDGNQWVDLLPWQHSDAVRPGTASNDLTVSAIGSRLSLSVNGTEVATHTDNTLTTGRVGIMAGGDGNQIAVEHFMVQTP